MCQPAPKDSKKNSQSESVETMLEITDPKEKQAVLNAKAKVKALRTTPRIVATSPAVADICDRLELDLWECQRAVFQRFQKDTKDKESRNSNESGYGNRIFTEPRLDYKSLFTGNRFKT
ncbi:MAG: hypothetical protein ACLVI9_02485 [Anaerostipes hadrus]